MSTTPSSSSIRVGAAALAAAAALVAALPAGASARELPARLKTPHKVTAPSSPVTAAVKTAPGARCSLHARAGRSTLRAPQVRADRRGRVVWSWLAPAKAPAGRWHVSVKCAKGHAHRTVSRSLIVSTSGRNRFAPLLQRSTGRVLTGGPARSLKHAPRLAAHTASVAANDPFPWGECTWWAAKKRPDLYPKVHGNAGDWLSEAQSAGVPTGSTPAVGAIAVFLPYDDGAGAYGHVAYVEAVNGDGTITVSEYNWAGYHVGPTTRRLAASAVNGFIYGGPVPTPSSAPPPSSAPASAPTGYNVYGTGSEGLIEHSGPDTSSPKTGVLANGASVNIACQTQSSSAVNGSAIWDKLANGSYVSDYFVDTPDVGTFTPSISRCTVPQQPPTSTGPTYVAPAGSTPQTYHVQRTGADGLYERSGPGTNYSQAGWLADGTTIQIACQVESNSSVNGSPVWDLLTDGKYVTDYYTDTPVYGNYSPGIGHCTAEPAL